jgi:hypothetical protein
MKQFRHYKLGVLVLLLCGGCIVPYSGRARARIHKDFLQKQVQIQRRCFLEENVGASGSPVLNLYDEQGHPTKYVSYEYYWLFGLFRKPDYRLGDNQFYDISRFHERLYSLSTNQTPYLLHPPISVYPIHEYKPEERFTLGPLGTYEIEKGTSVFVKRFKSLWGGGEFAPHREYLSVVLRFRLPGRTNEIDAVCDVDEFEKIMEAQP